MTGFTPPLHIDLIPRERRFKNERQYWFMTWIFGPDRVVVYCKLYNGWWRLETPKADNMFPVPEDTELLGKHRFAKSGDLKDYMDATLAEDVASCFGPLSKPVRLLIDTIIKPGTTSP